VPVEVSSDAKSTSQRIGLLLGPILFFVTLFLDLDLSSPRVTHMAAVTVLIATWWISDAIPLSATALLPLVLYPVLGIMKTRECAPIYVNSNMSARPPQNESFNTATRWTNPSSVRLGVRLSF